MSSLTTHVLGSASSSITNLENTDVITSKMVVVRIFQEDEPTKSTKKESGIQPHSPHFVRLSNWS